MPEWAALAANAARREVQIVRGDPSNPPGLPRPIAQAPDGRLRPVPFTNADTWGILDDERARKRDCLVCGLRVESGRVLCEMPGRPGSEALSAPDKGAHWAGTHTLERGAIDGAPLHERCFKLTEAHCEAVRIKLLDGDWAAPRWSRK